MSLLAPYRVLDLTTERGLLCGQVLADLGADVIKIEPPGGSPARRIGPFASDRVDEPEASLYWQAYNRNKRGITLDVAQPEGGELLLRLAAKADFFLESDSPGAMTALGLGYDDLAAVNPGLIYVSITPFGQDGPKAHYADSDLVILAASGFIALTGDDDRPPVRVTVPQAYLHASADGAAGALIALWERHTSGRGQQIDVSAQQSMNLATFCSSLVAALGMAENRRLSGGYKYGDYLLRQVFACKDGHVAITFLFGNAMGPFTRRLMEWVHAEGFCDEATRDIDWIGYGERLMHSEVPHDDFERLKETLETFTRTKTKDELLHAALTKRLLVAPVAMIDEVTRNEQLVARDYWREVDGVRHPGPFAKFSCAPIEYRRRAPHIGEHNREVYMEELGLSEAVLAELKAKGIV